MTNKKGQNKKVHVASFSLLLVIHFFPQLNLSVLVRATDCKLISLIWMFLEYSFCSEINKFQAVTSIKKFLIKKKKKKRSYGCL